MKMIGLKDIDEIALGASLLGAGGGGDPYIGKLIAMAAIEECGEVEMLDPIELEDDDLVLPIAMMGAPTILCEKGINGNEYQTVYDMMSRYFGKKIKAFMPMEAGGVNSMMPIAACARLGIPLVDADGMGRAFPELQMVTFTIGGVKATPMALTDEKGNTCIFETITNKWTEELARSVTMSCGGSVTVALYPMEAKTIKEYGVKQIVSRSQEIGRSILSLGNHTTSMKEQFKKDTGAYLLFKGKIADVQREVRGAFNFGKVMLEGIEEHRGEEAYVEFQNENLIAVVEGEIKATVPDLITLVDSETFIPITTDGLKYGKRVVLCALPCDPMWRTPKGLALVGPQYFGCDCTYIPLEERMKEGNENV